LSKPQPVSEGACFGFTTAFHNAHKTAGGNASISISISSVFCANNQCIGSIEILHTHFANVRGAVVDDLNDIIECRAFEILDHLAQFLLSSNENCAFASSVRGCTRLAAFLLVERLFLGAG